MQHDTATCEECGAIKDRKARAFVVINYLLWCWAQQLSPDSDATMDKYLATVEATEQ
jgi:hypothetical protein